MRHICWFLAALLASLFLSLPILAADQSHPERALIEEVLTLYGVKEQVTQLPALLEAQLERERDQYPPDVYPVLSQAFAQAYRADGLYEKVVAHLEAAASPEQLLAAREWLRTPLSQKMTRLEVEAASPQTQEKIPEFAAELESNPPSADRVSLVQELDEAVGATETTIAVSVATVRAVVRGVQPLLPAGKRLPEEEIEHGVARLEAELQSTMKYSTWLGFLYTYRSVSDQELTDYLAYWQSPEGRWLSQTTSDALLEAITAAAEDAGKRIAEAALQKRTSGGTAQFRGSAMASSECKRPQVERHRPVWRIRGVETRSRMSILGRNRERFRIDL